MADQTSETSSAPALGPAPDAPAQSPEEKAGGAVPPATSEPRQAPPDAAPTEGPAPPSHSSPPEARAYSGPTSLRTVTTLAGYDALIEEAILRRAEKVKEVTNEARSQHDHRMATLGGDLISLARKDRPDLAPLVDEIIARRGGGKKPDAAFVGWNWREPTRLSPGPSPWRRRTVSKTTETADD